MNDELNRALSPLGLMVIDLFARQMAMLSVLRSLPGFDEQSYKKELKNAQAQLKGIPGVATLQSHTDAQQLEHIEKLLRNLLLTK